MQYGVKIPHGWKEAVYIASKTAAFTRIRTSRSGEILPGIANDKKLAGVLVNILSDLGDALPESEVLNSSYMLCMTGRYPNPLGVPHLSSQTTQPNEYNLFALKIVRALTKALWLKSLDMDFSPLSIPSKSSCGFPYMETGNKGLLVRRAYIQSYVDHISYIRDLLGEKKWGELYDPRFGMLPMFPVCVTNWRMQPERAKSLQMQGTRVIGASWKQREVYNCLYEKCVSDHKIPGFNVVRSMRSRAICAVSSTVNMLYQANMLRLRKAIMSFPLWHITSVAESHRRAVASFPSGLTNTYDFSQMDRTMAADVWQAYEAGLRDAGASESLLNLARCIRYAPFLLTDDRVSVGASKKAPLRMIGSISVPDASSNDLGNRSGEADTDIFNKIAGTSTHIAAAVLSGCIAGLDAQSSPDAIVEHFLRTQCRCTPSSGDTVLFEGNCGDDHANRFQDAEAAQRHANVLAKMAPYWDVTVETDMQLLGWRLLDDGSSVPYMGRAISNFLCPERFWTDRMRKDFFMLGVKARDEHYDVNPEWRSIYRPLLNASLILNYGKSLEDYASIPCSLGALNPSSAAELELLYNSDAIMYKYDISEVSRDFLEALKLFFFVPEDVVEQLQL